MAKKGKNPVDLDGNGQLGMGDAVNFILTIALGILGLMVGSYLGYIEGTTWMGYGTIALFVFVGELLGKFVGIE